jgi:hypothetical protein
MSICRWQCVKYIQRVLNFALMIESLPSNIDVTAPVNYRILRAILTAKQPYLQTEVAEAAGAFTSQVSNIVRWLEDRKHVVRRRSDGKYETAQPASLVLSVFPYQRPMARALSGTIKVRGSMEEIGRLLTSEDATLCLESALAVHSGYFRPDRVAVYHPKPRKLLAGLTPDEGGLVPVAVYAPDIPLVGEVEEPDLVSPLRRTGKFRTLVDLVCDNRAYAAKDLFESLWGVQIG